MEWYLYLAVILAGVATGFINTLAGSGSAVSLTMLDFIGLPLNIANGTNRVAIFFQNIASSTTFAKNGNLDIKKSLPYALTAIPGGFLGAIFADYLSKEQFRFALGIVMCVILVTLFIKPSKWLEKESNQNETKFKIKDFFIFLAIGFYGGFIQIGVGVILLLGLVLSTGLNLVKSNGIKVFFIMFQTAPAMGYFIYKGLIRWDIGLTMAVGNMLGAWIGANQASKRGAKFVRYILIGIVSFAALKYLGILNLIF